MGYENRRCFLPLALVVLLSLFLFPLKASAFSSGSGTEGDPYIIMTAAHLNEIRDFPNAYFKLGADIDLDVPPLQHRRGLGADRGRLIIRRSPGR